MPTPTTREGYDKLKVEIAKLEGEDIPRVTQLVAEARAEGDLRENAEYHGQRENLAMLEAKLALLKTRLADCYIVEKPAESDGAVVFGSKVTVLDIGEGIEEVYELVGPGEEDYSGDILKILCTSPLAQQLLNHRVGEKVTVTVPNGKINYKIVAVN